MVVGVGWVVPVSAHPLFSAHHDFKASDHPPTRLWEIYVSVWFLLRVWNKLPLPVVYASWHGHMEAESSPLFFFPVPAPFLYVRPQDSSLCEASQPMAVYLKLECYSLLLSPVFPDYLTSITEVQLLILLSILLSVWHSTNWKYSEPQLFIEKSVLI